MEQLSAKAFSFLCRDNKSFLILQDLLKEQIITKIPSKIWYIRRIKISKVVRQQDEKHFEL